MADLFGQIVGWGSILAIVLLFIYSDDLSDGNVGSD